MNLSRWKIKILFSERDIKIENGYIWAREATYRRGRKYSGGMGLFPKDRRYEAHFRDLGSYETHFFATNAIYAIEPFRRLVDLTSFYLGKAFRPPIIWIDKIWDLYYRIKITRNKHNWCTIDSKCVINNRRLLRTGVMQTSHQVHKNFSSITC